MDEIIVKHFHKVGPYQLYLYDLGFVPLMILGIEGLMWNWVGYTPNTRCA